MQKQIIICNEIYETLSVDDFMGQFLYLRQLYNDLFMICQKWWLFSAGPFCVSMAE